MNKITLCILFAFIALFACVASFTHAREEQQQNDSAALLRKLARNLYPDASDRQIIRKIFPRVKSIKRRASVDSVVKSLSDASSFDCSRYCAGSYGDSKISCYQHCMRYSL